jgi:hypothetical protein
VGLGGHELKQPDKQKAQNSALMSNVFNELRGGFLHERAIHMPLLL